MKNLLFPEKFKIVGWIIFVAAVVAGCLIWADMLQVDGVAETAVNDAAILINGVEYFRFMAANLVLFPIIYVILFSLEMRRYNKMSEDEE